MSDNSLKYLCANDFLVTGESFDLVPNPEGDFLRTEPQPKSENLGSYYESEEYISHTDKKKGLLSGIYQVVKKWSIRKKTNLIFDLNKGPGSLLDIGAGTGDFLKFASEKGWEVSGMEPNIKAAALSLKKGIGLKASLEEFKQEKFDVVTLWHVLEHIPDLEKTTELLRNLVKENGWLIIAVPNFKSYDAQHYGKYWAAYDVPRHLWHFSKNSIIRLFKADFQLRKVEPMIFDSFYVSLLSEKYKNGKSFSLKALWIGFKSNLKAKSTKEYSSHIYCLQRTK